MRGAETADMNSNSFVVQMAGERAVQVAQQDNPWCRVVTAGAAVAREIDGLIVTLTVPVRVSYRDIQPDVLDLLADNVPEVRGMVVATPHEAPRLDADFALLGRLRSDWESSHGDTLQSTKRHENHLHHPTHEG